MLESSRDLMYLIQIYHCSIESHIQDKIIQLCTKLHFKLPTIAFSYSMEPIHVEYLLEF